MSKSSTRTGPAFWRGAGIPWRDDERSILPNSPTSHGCCRARASSPRTWRSVRGAWADAPEDGRAILFRSPARKPARNQPLRLGGIRLRAPLQCRSLLAQGPSGRFCCSSLAGWDRDVEAPDDEPRGAYLSRVCARDRRPSGQNTVALPRGSLTSVLARADEMIE